MYPNHPTTYPNKPAPESPSTRKQAINHTRVEIQRDRGILYVYRDDGRPLLKVTGLPMRLPDLHENEYELHIEVLTPAFGEERPRPIYFARAEPIGEAAEQSAESLLKQAGATLPPPQRNEH